MKVFSTLLLLVLVAWGRGEDATETGDDVTTEMSDGSQQRPPCNERCQELVEKWKKRQKELQQCKDEANFTAESTKKLWSCNGTYDENALKFEVCWYKVRGILQANGSVDVDWATRRAQPLADRCAAYHFMSASAARRSFGMDAWCRKAQNVQQSVTKCLQEGKEAEAEGDGGEAAAKAMIACTCESFKSRGGLWKHVKSDGRQRPQGQDEP